jgi:hypothetical protein
MLEADKARMRELLRNPTRRYVTGIVSIAVALLLAALFWLLRAAW